jgi:hypothetical protein
VANTYHCASMRAKAEAYIHRHFENVYQVIPRRNSKRKRPFVYKCMPAVCQGDEFLSLPLDQLLQLLSSESVSISSEEVTFKGAFGSGQISLACGLS